MPTAGDHMQPLKDAINHKLMPTLVKHELIDMDWNSRGCLCGLEVLPFDDSVVDLGHKHADSIKCTTNLTQQILENGADLMHSNELDCKRKAAVWQHQEASLKVKADDLQRCLPEGQQCAMAQAQERGRLKHTHHHPCC